MINVVTVIDLCAPGDVRRMLHRSAAQIADGVVQPFIDTASQFVVNFCKQDFASSGPVTESFYDIRQDDKIYLRDTNATGITITATTDPGGQVSALVLNSDYQLQGGGGIQMLFQEYGFPQGLEGAVVSFTPDYYSEVNVSYTGVSVVPVAVRDATALIAASIYQQSPRIAAGLESEHIADYSYSMPAVRADQIPPLARQWLRQYSTQKHRIRVT